LIPEREQTVTCNSGHLAIGHQRQRRYRSRHEFDSGTDWEGRAFTRADKSRWLTAAVEQPQS